MRTHWLMMRHNGTVWITAGKYTFDEAVKRHRSLPVFPVADRHVQDYRTAGALVHGMMKRHS